LRYTHGLPGSVRSIHHRDRRIGTGQSIARFGPRPRTAQNLFIEGPAGVGKSGLTCALGHKACRDNRSVLYQRVPPNVRRSHARPRLEINRNGRPTSSEPARDARHSLTHPASRMILYSLMAQSHIARERMGRGLKAYLTASASVGGWRVGGYEDERRAIPRLHGR
jgi:IstB-like ATP binding protein